MRVAWSTRRPLQKLAGHSIAPSRDLTPPRHTTALAPAAAPGDRGRVRLTLDCSGWADTELVAAIGQHCAEAYRELLKRHLDSVTRAARVTLRFGADADDVATDAFVHLWLHPTSFDPARCSVVGYLRMSAKLRSIDLFRSTSARRRREEKDYGEGASPAPETGRAMMHSEEAALVRKSLTTLSRVERDVIETAFFGGKSYVDVARELGLPEGTVKARIRSGLKRLRLSQEIQALLDNHHGEEVGPVAAPTPEKLSESLSVRGMN